MNLVMPPTVRRHVRSVTSGVILTLLVMVSAECVTAEDLTPAQMACCAMMNHDCGEMAPRQSCCSTVTPRVDQGSALPRMSLPVPHAPVIQLTMHAAASYPPISEHAPSFRGFEPKPPGVPTYLLISTFRI